MALRHFNMFSGEEKRRILEGAHWEEEIRIQNSTKRPGKDFHTEDDRRREGYEENNPSVEIKESSVLGSPLAKVLYVIGGAAALALGFNHFREDIKNLESHVLHPTTVSAPANPAARIPRPGSSGTFAVLVEGSGEFLPGVYSEKNAAESLREMEYLHRVLAGLGVPESHIFGPGEKTSTIGKLENTLGKVEGEMGDKSTLLLVVADPFPKKEATNRESKDPNAVSFSPGSYIALGGGNITFTDSASPSRINVSEYLTSKDRTILVVNAYGAARSKLIFPNLSGIPNLTNTLAVYLSQINSLKEMADRIEKGYPLGEVFGDGKGYSPQSTFFNGEGGINSSASWPSELYWQKIGENYQRADLQESLNSSKGVLYNDPRNSGKGINELYHDTGNPKSVVKGRDSRAHMNNGYSHKGKIRGRK